MLLADKNQKVKGEKRMKRIVALLLCISLFLLCGCSQNHPNETVKPTERADSNPSPTPSTIIQLKVSTEPDIIFTGMDDPALLTYMEDAVYSNLVMNINSSEYLVESVQAVYVSKEYLEELEYNSKTNVFFGYSLADIDNFFKGEKYVFTLGDDGNTVVRQEVAIDDTTYNQIVKNVAIGTGVILVCVIITVASEGAGAPAAAAIFAASAKTGAICALSGAVIGGVATGAVKAYETGDVESALKAAALGASEGYKWGAISGAVSGAATEALTLKSMTAGGLTMNEAAIIQSESGYPASVISELHNMEEYEALKSANLQPYIVNGKTALIRGDIDPFSVDEFGRTNLQRMENGLAPLDATGKSFQLHHIGQESDGTLAILTSSEHENSALHGFKLVSEIDRADFAKTRNDFYKSLAEIYKDALGLI